MSVELNQALKSFRDLSYGNYGADDRVIVSGGNEESVGAKGVSLSQHSAVRQVNGKTTALQNNSVRTMLLGALRDQFTSGIPESVRRALVGSGKFGAGDMREKNGAVNTGRPLTMRRIRAVIQAVETELGKELQLNALDRNLKSGLLADDTKVADEGTLGKLLTGLENDERVGQLLQKDESLQAKHQSLLEAQNACKQARAGLEGLLGKDIADDVGNARERLAAAVAAESELADKITSFTSEVRKFQPQRQTSASALLRQLDDLATSTELNAARIERLGAELAELKDDEAVNRLSPEFEALVRGGSALSKDERTEAENEIRRYAEASKSLLEGIAQLETMPPNAETAEIAGKLGDALVSAEAELAKLSNRKGIDPEAVRQLRSNLAAARNTLVTCSGEIRKQMLEGMSRELAQMLKDSRGILGNIKLAACSPNIAAYIQKLIAIMDNDWLPKLANGTPAERDAVFTKASEIIVKGDKDPNKSRVLQRVGLTKFMAKHALREKLSRDTSPDEPFSRISVKLLAQALRGEIDVMNYLSLKTAGYTDEMFWADLVVKPGSEKKSVGTGSFNEVYKQEMTNVRTGATETLILKDVEFTGASSQYGIGGTFSSEKQVVQTDKINVATSKAATLLGCGQQVTRCGMVRVGDRYQLAQEMAHGDTVFEAVENQARVFEMPDPDHVGQRKIVSFAEGFGGLKPPAQERLKVELQLAAVKLEWADLLTGQIDRSRRNIMIKFNVTGAGDDARVEVVLKGIDNDIGFTEGQTGLFRFESKKVAGQKYNIKNTGDQQELVYGGVHGLRVPAFLPLSVKRHLDVLDEKTFRREMGGLLGEKALDAAVGRLKELKKLARTIEKDGRLVDDVDRTKTPNAQTLSRFVHQNVWFDHPDLHVALGNIYAEFLQE